MYRINDSDINENEILVELRIRRIVAQTSVYIFADEPLVKRYIQQAEIDCR